MSSNKWRPLSLTAVFRASILAASLVVAGLIDDSLTEVSHALMNAVRASPLVFCIALNTSNDRTLVVPSQIGRT